MDEAPYFSIGVTTYNRHELLKQTLMSILGQTFPNFEVIVGNDYTRETLSAELLGIDDPRVRFVNHAQNLGELGNMNSLLEMSHGTYFTWQYDDDLYAPDFLEGVHSALVSFDFPPCVFTSFEIIHSTSFPELTKRFSGQEKLFSGRRFLREYLSGRIKAMGFTGVCKTEYLKRIGGAERLTDGPFALHSEYLFLVRAGLLEKVAYIDAPLVLFRAHEGSWGGTSKDVHLFKQAGQNLIRESVKVLTKPELRDDFYPNLSSLLKLPLLSFIARLADRNACLDQREVVAYLVSMKGQFNALKGTALYWLALVSLGQTAVWSVWPVAKAKIKLAAPPGLLKLARTVRSFLVRHERRPFWG